MSEGTVATTLAELAAELERRPTTTTIEGAMTAAMAAAHCFSSVEEVVGAARILARVNLATGMFGGFGCSSPACCTEASLLLVWLNRPKEEHFGIDEELVPGVARELKEWIQRSAACSCTHSFNERSAKIESARDFCAHGQRTLYMKELFETFGNNIATAALDH